MYQRSGQWTCPLCKKSGEDMSEYFAQIDAAVRMQPMPASYAGTMSNIYCQDCCKSCVVPYHFVPSSVLIAVATTPESSVGEWRVMLEEHRTNLLSGES